MRFFNGLGGKSTMEGGIRAEHQGHPKGGLRRVALPRPRCRMIDPLYISSAIRSWRNMEYSQKMSVIRST